MKAALLLLLLAASQCLAEEPDFTPLFGEETLTGWTLLPRERPSGQWHFEGATLVAEGKPGNLASDGKFGDFDLRVDWKIGPMGNSGVFYRVAEPGNPASTAIEYQIADNARKASVGNPDRRAGAAYGLYGPPEGVSRPTGEWNSLRIVARGQHIEHWLNGHRVAAFAIGSDDFKRRAAAKFAGKNRLRQGPARPDRAAGPRQQSVVPQRANSDSGLKRAAWDSRVLRYPESMRYARRHFILLAAAGSAGLLRTHGNAASEIKFHDVESQSRQFMKWYADIKLTASQESVKKTALDPIPAPCCSDNSAYTCCCPCNMSRTIWGLSQYMIAKQNATAPAVRTKVKEWISFIGPNGFSGSACYTGRMPTALQPGRLRGA